MNQLLIEAHFPIDAGPLSTVSWNNPCNKRSDFITHTHYDIPRDSHRTS